jgi:hypothetical protein
MQVQLPAFPCWACKPPGPCEMVELLFTRALGRGDPATFACQAGPVLYLQPCRQ